MILIRPTMLSTTLLFTAAIAQADGLIQSLPEDGSWVRYHMSYKLFGPGTVPSETTGSREIRSVGTLIHDGQKCRWLEFTESVNAPDGSHDHKILYRFLIPEQHLGAGKDSLTHVVRGTFRLNDEEPHDFDKRPPVGHSRWLHLPDSTKNVRPLLETRTFDYQRGKLQTEPAREEQVEVPEPEESPRSLMTSTICPSKNVPFGVGAAKIELKRVRNGTTQATFVRELSVTDFGTGAKSELPDRK